MSLSSSEEERSPQHMRAMDGTQGAPGTCDAPFRPNCANGGGYTQEMINLWGVPTLTPWDKTRRALYMPGRPGRSEDSELHAVANLPIPIDPDMYVSYASRQHRRITFILLAIASTLLPPLALFGIEG